MFLYSIHCALVRQVPARLPHEAKAVPKEDVRISRWSGKLCDGDQQEPDDWACGRKSMGANIALTDLDGRTPLHEAVTACYPNMVNLFLENDEAENFHDCIKAGDKFKRTALHYAAEDGCVEMICGLLDRIADV
ncbi:hypothetical protein PG999_001381 [Apiospora kogelbergensis]|uniref:Ankyrin repeat-containing protein n=1 Tax=Apiospora kogelbergensis TaxID=1337665 RepID=A0AAW0REI6_9PEZI